MTGPNNYGNRIRTLLQFVRDNPRVKRETILARLGYEFAYSFDRAKDTKKILPTKDSTYKDKYWVINERLR